MKKLLLFLSLLLVSSLAFSQKQGVKEQRKAFEERKKEFKKRKKKHKGTATEKEAKELLYQDKKNVIKLNLTSAVFKNVQFQYERVFNKTVSFNISYAHIFEGNIAQRSTIDNLVDDAEFSRITNNAKLAYYSFTPEARIYVGKGYGKGFYIAPFFRYSNYNLKDIDFEYELDNGSKGTLRSNGEITGTSYGLLLGIQFNLTKRIVLDWWIIGPHYGSGKGEIEGISPVSLSTMEQESLLKGLNEIDASFINPEYEVSADRVKATIKGPWGGVRAGLSIGFRL